MDCARTISSTKFYPLEARMGHIPKNMNVICIRIRITGITLCCLGRESKVSQTARLSPRVVHTLTNQPVCALAAIC